MINDVFNRPNQKALASLDQPFVLVVSFNYRVPELGPNRLVRTLAGDWTLSGVMNYQSGALIAVPGAQNNLSTLLFRSTLANRVPGQPLYLTDINGPFDANKQFLLNPAAWSDPAAGQWGTSAPYYSDYRGRRLPNEQAALGRLFRLREGISLEFRMEFTNIFNRRIYSGPSASNALATQTTVQGVPTSGFGYINASGSAGATALATDHGSVGARGGRQLQAPPHEYGAIQPFTSWNGPDAKERMARIVQDLDRLAANGIFVVNVSPGRGEPMYLSPEHMDQVKFVVQEAARSGG